MLYDVNQKQLLIDDNPRRCNTRIAPDSTFKIALSLMAFDRRLITQDTFFRWDGKDKGRPEWNQNQSPRSWLQYSTVWVSQTITPKLGKHTIEKYLSKFHYGNKDFSGGITRAWLSNSLKISATEQLAFLQSMLAETLPVSHAAIINTEKNLYLETLPDGYELYGKTGSGYSHNSDLQDGWFVGFLKKQNQTFIVVANFTDLQNTPETSEPAGLRAKAIAKKIIYDLGQL